MYMYNGVSAVRGDNPRANYQMDWRGFQKKQQKCDIEGQTSNYEYTDETNAIN